MTVHAYRASLLHMLSEPSSTGNAPSHEYIGDGGILVKDGIIETVDAWSTLEKKLPEDVPVSAFPGCLIVPGFVDTHIHFPQTDIMAARATGLLNWLEKHAFPAEARFADATHAKECAGFFLDELLRNGTTAVSSGESSSIAGGSSGVGAT